VGPSSIVSHGFFFPKIIYIPNGIKTDGDFFGIYMIFGKKNPRETVPEVATRQGARAAPLGAPLTLVGHP